MDEPATAIETNLGGFIAAILAVVVVIALPSSFGIRGIWSLALIIACTILGNIGWRFVLRKRKR